MTTTSTTMGFHVGCFPDFAKTTAGLFTAGAASDRARYSILQRIIGYFIRDCRNAFIVFALSLSASLSPSLSFTPLPLFFFIRFLFYFIWTHTNLNLIRVCVLCTQLRYFTCVACSSTDKPILRNCSCIFEHCFNFPLIAQLPRAISHHNRSTL